MTINWIWVCKAPSSDLGSFLPLCLCPSQNLSRETLLSPFLVKFLLPFHPQAIVASFWKRSIRNFQDSGQIFPESPLPTLTQGAFVSVALTTTSLG